MRQVTLVLVALFSSAALFAQTPPPEVGPAIVCNEKYALCIKAPCVPNVTRDKATGEYTITEATCECVVLSGWSMGPGDCESRRPKHEGIRTYLVSTYSNYFNKTNMTLTCPKETTWAWCYGSPCVEDLKDKNKAICTCPVQIGIGMTLGGECHTANCTQIWSAATPAASAFANDYFHKWMTDHGLQSLPPATDCPTHWTAPPKK